ncbi:MAG: ferrochelatase [Acidimicrobiia bacterium]|nr:ferrochelatase [Acidimicrobiia bacterium]
MNGLVVMAYGTPASPDDIEAYYTDIRRGRPPQPEQLADLTRRYEAIGGTSPLAAITAAQRDALQAALDDQGPGEWLVAVGTKHAAPSIESAVEELTGRGAQRLVGLVLAPHYSSMSVGQYHGRARAAADGAGVPFVAVDSWALEPAYVEFLVGEVRQRMAVLPDNTKVLFTAHSLPQRILAAGDPYPDEVRSTAAAVAAASGLAAWAQWSVGWQSAGRTAEPWIGPDILTVIDDLAAAESADGLLVCPCGFTADHLEVLYDLDIEARARAEERGLTFDRTASMNADPTVLRALARLVMEAAA